MEINKESFNMCFWKGEICKVIVLMYEIIRESIKVMEHFWEFYPNAFNVQKSAKTIQKPNKKVHFKEVCSSKNLATCNYKKSNSKKPKNLSLPKILVNNVEANKFQPRYVKNNNFVMPKNPFKSCKENPMHLKNTIFASKSDEKTSINCSTAQYSSLEEIKISKDKAKKDAFELFSKCSSKSCSKSRIRSFRDIPDELSLDKNTNKIASTSATSLNNFRISNNKPVARSLVNLDLTRREKGKNILKNVKISNNLIN